MPSATPKGKKRGAAAIQAESSPQSVKRTRTKEKLDEAVAEKEVVQVETVSKRTPKKSPKSKATTTLESLDDREAITESPKERSKGKGKGKSKAVSSPTTNGIEPNGEPTNAKPRRKRKTKEEKEAEMLPLAPRTVGSKLLLGAHVSSAGGVQNAVLNSVHIGGNAFALFLKSQRKWENPPLLETACSAFIANCSTHKYTGSGVPPIVPHGSYLVNLAHPDEERARQAYASFLDDLTRCQRLGIGLYNFHPGNAAASNTRGEAIAAIATHLNRAHADPSTGSVITLLETMAAGGNTIGSRFEELRDIIAAVDAKDRVGVCLDTCHVFAARYDIRTPQTLSDTLDKFDETVGLKYLMALHVNDSKAPLGSGRDLHANIGTGFIGLRGFHSLVNEERLWGLPMVLETPIDAVDEKGKKVEDKGIWAREIKLLESLIGMDVEGEEFARMERELSEKGRSERERVQKQVDKKKVKGKGKEKDEEGHDSPEKTAKGIREFFKEQIGGNKTKTKGKKKKDQAVETTDTQRILAEGDEESSELSYVEEDEEEGDDD
jgi:AP endonuclease-1